MKLKLDENLDERLADRLCRSGLDVSTVRRQGLGGTSDDALFRRCRQEERALVTLDLDFANPLRFPPKGTAGVIVLRLRRPLLANVRALVDTLTEMLSRSSPRNQLWIVEPGRVRIHLDTGTE